MKNFLLAERYANGLLASLDQAELDAVDAELADMVALVDDNPHLSHVLYNQALSLQVRVQVLREVMQQAGFSDTLIRLGALLLRRGRIRVLPDIAQCFSIQVDEKLGRARASVTTALPLDEQQQRMLRQSLQAYNGSDIHLYYNVDADILGGVIAQIGSLRIDGSVRNRLRHLRETLLSTPS